MSSSTTGSGLLGSDQPLYQAFDAALVDLDGVCYKGPHSISSAPPALAAAREAGMKLVFVTNNASREPETVADHLTELGIPATVDEVLTAAQAGAELLGSVVKPGDRVLVVGGDGLRTAVTQAGYEIVDQASDRPVAVIQGFAPEVGWEHLAQATYAIQRGARFVATNLDLTLPNEHGMAPGNGSLVGVVTTATGVAPISAGKPQPNMFALAAVRAGAARPLVIGDRLDTDLKGARAARMPGLLVLTGVNDAHDAMAAPADQRPSFIGEDLATLAQPHPTPQQRDSAWMVGQATATVDDGVVGVTGGTSIDRVRAACAAAWDAADSGGTVDVYATKGLG